MIREMYQTYQRLLFCSYVVAWVISSHSLFLSLTWGVPECLQGRQWPGSRPGSVPREPLDAGTPSTAAREQNIPEAIRLAQGKKAQRIAVPLVVMVRGHKVVLSEC